MKAAWLLIALLGCKAAEESPRTQQRPAAGSGKNIVDDDVRRALVLDAAIKKLEGELAELEADPTTNAAEIAQKKDALEALRSTLVRTQRKIDMAKGAGVKSD